MVNHLGGFIQWRKEGQATPERKFSSLSNTDRRRAESSVEFNGTASDYCEAEREAGVSSTVEKGVTDDSK